MPNWVTNVVTINADPQTMDTIWNKIKCDDEKNFHTIDFNKIIPMPSDLDIVCGSSTKEGLKVYLTSISPDTSFFNDYKEKVNRDKYEQIVEQINNVRHFYTASTLTEDELQKHKKDKRIDELHDLGKQAVDNILKYGAPTWYEWCIDNWGTKWNACNEMEGDDNQIVFDTAWTAPFPILCELSKQYPTARFNLRFADENIGYNTGEIDFANGNETDVYMPYEGSDEAVAFAENILY